MSGQVAADCKRSLRLFQMASNTRMMMMETSLTILRIKKSSPECSKTAEKILHYYQFLGENQKSCGRYRN